MIGFEEMCLRRLFTDPLTAPADPRRKQVCHCWSCWIGRPGTGGKGDGWGEGEGTTRTCIHLPQSHTLPFTTIADRHNQHTQCMLNQTLCNAAIANT